MIKRPVTTVTIKNNPTSVPPLSIALIQKNKVFRTPVSGLQLTGTGGAGGYTFAEVTSVLATNGLTLNTATGAITGTPTTVGTIKFTAKVTDSATNPAQANFTIVVNSRLTVVKGSPIGAEHNSPYSYQFAVSGNTGTVTYSNPSGSLLGSTTLSSGGLLSGASVSTSGGFSVSFVVRATDGGSGDTLDIPCIVNVFGELKASISSTHNTLIVGTPKTLIELAVGYLGGSQPFFGSVDAGTPLPSGLTATFNNDGSVTFLASDVFASTLIQFDVRDSLGFTTLTSGCFIAAINATPSGDSGNALSIGTDNALFVNPSSGGGTPYGVASGTNTYTVALGLSSYTTGQLVAVKFTNANTSTSVTLNSDTLGAKNVLLNGSAPPIGYLAAVSTVDLVYNGTAFDIIGETNTGPVGPQGAPGAGGATGPTGPTNRFLFYFSNEIQSTKSDATNKLTAGTMYIDPTLAAWGTGSGSTFTLFAELETTNAAIGAAADLYQLDGTGGPQLVATLPTVFTTTPTKTSVSVNTAFRPASGVAANYAVRVWIPTANGIDFATILNCWLEAQP